jgi:AAA family ATP:ADP antiporter
VSSDGGDWDFLAARKREMAERRDSDPPAAEAPEAQEPPPTRARGELRADMPGVSLKRRAIPMAIALAAVSLAGFLTEMVAASQMLSLAGPTSLLIMYPLGGLGLLVAALLQFRYVDAASRLRMLRIVTFIYALVFAGAFVLITGSFMPVIAIGLVWLLADQLNFLVPLLVWSLAGDEFNVAEGRKVFGWLVTWTYVGQIAGLAIAAGSPFVLQAVDIPLTTLLAINPVVCVALAILLPRAMRSSGAARGLARDESLRAALASAWDFVTGVPIWRTFLLGSILTFAAGMTGFIAFMVGAGDLLDLDAGSIQVYFGTVSLAAFIIAWLLQSTVAERILERLGIPGTLLVLPVATVLAGVLLALGSALGSLAVLAIAITLWRVPRWSLDENARRAALALVPDERRTRVSFLVDLLPVALGLIVSTPLAIVGVITGQLWIVGIVVAVIAAIAVPFGVKVMRGWDDSLLNWRLRRRKQNRTLDFG